MAATDGSAAVIYVQDPGYAAFGDDKKFYGTGITDGN